MYQTDTGPCDVGTRPPMPAGGWVGPTAANVNAAVAAANSGWDSVLFPAWQSFVSLGPQAALQGMNPPYTSSAGGGQAVGAPGASGSTTPGTPGSGPGSVVQKNGLTADQNQFLSIFGPYRPFSVFTGPLPAAGTSGSLVYGGSVFNRPASGARVVSSPGGGAGSPQSPLSSNNSGDGISTSSPSGSCPTFPGVNALPWGESVVTVSPAGSGSAGSSLPAWGWAALAGIAVLFFADQDDKKRKGRS